jgi:hypothetical protein
MAVTQNLSITETYVDAEKNSSDVRIVWTSTQSGDSHNDYEKIAKYYISINGAAEIAYAKSYTLPANTTKTILDGRYHVYHRDDGSATISVRTWMDTGISAGVVEKSKTLNLTTIPRASTITSADSVTLGSRCKIIWTPASASFYYKVKFAIGSWSHTTEAFKPGVTSPYTYTGYPIPMDVASNFPDNTSGTMTATLYTYSDSGTTQVGSASSKTFTVTLPENETTKPSIRMTLSPVTPYEKFSSLYLQGISKVKATFEGEGKYGASIVAYSLQAEGGRYTEPYISNILAQSGESTIVGFVSDSRWFGNNTIQKINVIAYDAPYISPSSGYTKIICERCMQDGIVSESGTYLHVKGKRNYTKINSDGIVNTCSVKCRYKTEGGSWSHKSGEGVGVLLSTDTSTDDFDVILPGIVSDPKFTYVVELNIVDDTDLPYYIEFRIPSESVDFELREGGKGAAFGKHATKEKCLECEWDADFNSKSSFAGVYLQEKEIMVEGDDNTYYPVHIKPSYYSLSQPAYLGIGKELGTTSGKWEGNHSNGTSSLAAGWLLRYNGWDGNGSITRTLFKVESFAPLLAHADGYGNAAMGFVVYLRGGGASYKVACSVPFAVQVYLAETDISEQDNYNISVSPMTTIGNRGILYKNAGEADAVIEEGASDIWYYRKWSSGKVECWGRRSVGVNIKEAWGTIYYGSVSAYAYPSGLFISAPMCQVTAEFGSTSQAAWLAVSGKSTKDNAPAVFLCRPMIAEAGFDILYYAIGNWK